MHNILQELITDFGALLINLNVITYILICQQEVPQLMASLEVGILRNSIGFYQRRTDAAVLFHLFCKVRSFVGCKQAVQTGNTRKYRRILIVYGKQIFFLLDANINISLNMLLITLCIAGHLKISAVLLVQCLENSLISLIHKLP